MLHALEKFLSLVNRPNLGNDKEESPGLDPLIKTFHVSE